MFLARLAAICAKSLFLIGAINAICANFQEVPGEFRMDKGKEEKQEWTLLFAQLNAVNSAYP